MAPYKKFHPWIDIPLLTVLGMISSGSYMLYGLPVTLMISGIILFFLFMVRGLMLS